VGTESHWADFTVNTVNQLSQKRLVVQNVWRDVKYRPRRDVQFTNNEVPSDTTVCIGFVAASAGPVQHAASQTMHTYSTGVHVLHRTQTRCHEPGI